MVEVLKGSYIRILTYLLNIAFRTQDHLLKKEAQGVHSPAAIRGLPCD